MSDVNWNHAVIEQRIELGTSIELWISSAHRVGENSPNKWDCHRCKKLHRELILFKEKHEENEKDLVRMRKFYSLILFIAFAFCRNSISWPRRIFLEILQYLILNDAMKAFSERILPTLSVYRIRLQLSDASLMLAKMILRRMKFFRWK